ncbi:hypothetical protein [Bradyrhizobium valentinum]|uniref:hypothetical protein n=1 Tax=Bradyrhizobium valentinum TaxID=1518501 RepID=UPI0012E39BD3|nr:hypothetical protein [Bradyrhizobium valentinum]
MSEEEELSPNAVRTVVEIVREQSVPPAAKSLGITRSSLGRISLSWKPISARS